MRSLLIFLLGCAAASAGAAASVFSWGYVLGFALGRQNAARSRKVGHTDTPPPFRKPPESVERKSGPTHVVALGHEPSKTAH